MKNQIKQAVILAAGKGTRLGELTQNCPKPLIHVGGEPIICRSLAILRDLGFEKVVINTHYLAEKLENCIANWTGCNASNMEVVFSREKELLEIGGGLRKALEYLDNKPFLVINGDIVWQENFHPLIPNLISGFAEDNMDSLMAISPVFNSANFRKVLGDVDIDAYSKATFSGVDKLYNYMGIQVVSPRLVKHLPLGEANILRNSWEKSMANQSVSGYVYDFPWADMGSLKGLEIAQNLVAQQLQKAG